MHSDPQLLLLRTSFFSRAVNSVHVEMFLWPDLDCLACGRSAVLQPNGISGMVRYYTFATDFVLFCTCRYKINLLCTVCALMIAVLAGISSGDVEARENRPMRNILDNTGVRSVASSSRIRTKSCLILFLHKAVCRVNGSLFVTSISPAEMSYRGGGAQAEQERGALPELQFWSLSSGMPPSGLSARVHSCPSTNIGTLRATRSKEAPPQTSGI